MGHGSRTSALSNCVDSGLFRKHFCCRVRLQLVCKFHDVLDLSTRTTYLWPEVHADYLRRARRIWPLEPHETLTPDTGVIGSLRVTLLLSWATNVSTENRSPNEEPMPAANGHRSRRSSRLPVSVPVRVTSLEPNGKFSEICETLVVNAHGCAMRFPIRLSPGIGLRLHSREGREAIAYVVACMPV